MVTVTESNIRVNTFKTIYDLINANKPSGWTVLSSFPESKPVFPCIVINPAQVRVINEGFRVDNRENKIIVELGFFAKASSRKEAVDTALDTIQNVILSNESTLESNGLMLDTNTPFDQTNVDTIVVNGEKLHIAEARINLVLI